MIHIIMIPRYNSCLRVIISVFLGYRCKPWRLLQPQKKYTPLNCQLSKWAYILSVLCVQYLATLWTGAPSRPACSSGARGAPGALVVIPVAGGPAPGSAAWESPLMGLTIPPQRSATWWHAVRHSKFNHLYVYINSSCHYNVLNAGGECLTIGTRQSYMWYTTVSLVILVLK